MLKGKSYSHIIEIVYLYYINICYDIFVSYEFLSFIWNMFNSKIIKIYHIITIQSYPLNSYRFITNPQSFNLGNLFLEKTPLNLDSF